MPGPLLHLRALWAAIKPMSWLAVNPRERVRRGRSANRDWTRLDGGAHRRA
jgi:hypothetical protein